MPRQEHFSGLNSGKYGSEKIRVGQFLGQPGVADFTETLKSK